MTVSIVHSPPITRLLGGTPRLSIEEIRQAYGDHLTDQQALQIAAELDEFCDFLYDSVMRPSARREEV
jgi:hypothetical protein